MGAELRMAWVPPHTVLKLRKFTEKTRALVAKAAQATIWSIARAPWKVHPEGRCIAVGDTTE